MKSILIVLALVLSVLRADAGVSKFEFRGGTGWSSPVMLPEGPAIVWSNDAAVLLQTPVRLHWATALFRPVLYLDAAYCEGEVRAVGQDHTSGQLIEISERGTRAFGPSFGQNATAIACVGGQFHAYVQFSPTGIAVSDLDAMTTTVVTVPHTSQGIRDVVSPSGEIRRGDDWFRFPNQYGHGRSIHEPVERCGVYIGQDSNANRILALLPDRVFTVISGVAFSPGIECFDGGFFTTARVDRIGAVLTIVTAPYPPHEPLTPTEEICGNKIDDNGNGLVDEGCPIEPPQLPGCAAGGGSGIENGVVVNFCQWFFNALVQGQPATRWATILNGIEPSLWAKGFGQQRRSSGEVAARFFMPTPICPNAAPPPDDERAKFLGVRQDERCWDQLGRIVDPVTADGTQWIWHERGAQPYQPFTGGVIIIDPPPPTDLDTRVAALETELRQTQAKVNGLESALAEVSHRVTTLEQKPDGGALSPDQLRLLEGLRQFFDLLKNGFSTGRADQILPHAHLFRWEPAR